MTADKLDQFESVDVSLQDKDKLKNYLDESFDGMAGTSLKNLMHMGQLFNSGVFQKFDYGKTGNQAIYGQESVPLIDISKIQTPVVLVVAGRDKLGNKIDNLKVKEDLSAMCIDF